MVSLILGAGPSSPPVAPTLNALTLTPNTATVGTPYSGTISGKTASSVIALSGGWATVSGTSVTGTPTAAGSLDLTETLAGATNSPRTTPGALTVSSAGVATTMFASEYNPYAINTESRGRTGNYNRWQHYIPVDHSEIEFAFNAWRLPATGTITNASNDIPITEAYAEYNGVAIPLTFGGATSRRITPGENDVRTQVLTPASFGFSGNFPAGSVIWTKVIVIFDATTGSMINTARATADVSGSVSAFYDPAATTLGNVSGPGPVTVTGTALDGRTLGYQPFCLGKAVNPTKVFLARGDSITQNLTDAVANRAGRGWFQIAMKALGYPSANFATSGIPASGGNGNPLMEYWYAFANRGVVFLGTNTFGTSGSGSVALVQSNNKAVTDAMKAKGITAIGVSKMLPRASSASYPATDDATQTVQSGWGAGGNPDAYNTQATNDPAAFLAATGGTYVIPMDSVRSATDKYKWKAGQNADETHPNNAGHTAMANEAQSILGAA